MSCPVCRDKRLVEIHVNLRGSQLTLRSCSHCETRWWETDGRQVPLTNVFELAAPER